MVSRSVNGLGTASYRGLGVVLVLLGALLAVQTVLAASIDVSLDRNPVPINESFTVTFTASAEPDSEPDFTALQQDFEIISQGQSSQFSLNNGRASRQISWQVQLVARKTGTLDIPSIAFGRDRSNPFTVTVTNGAVRGKQGGEANIFVEVEAEPKNPYVQAQTLITVRVLSRVAFSGDLSPPIVEGATLDKLEQDHEYVTSRDGVQFKVDERRYAFFPQKSGHLSIAPVNLTVQVAGANAMFNPMIRQGGKTQRLHSDPIELEVRPIPPQFAGKQWLPAAKLELSESWTPTTLQVASGDPLTRTLTLRAEGATVGLLPELSAGELPTHEVKQYPDQPVMKEDKLGSGFSSMRQQKTAFIASRPGSYSLPRIEIPWWNTQTDRMEIARLPERTLTVKGAVPSPAAPPPSAISAPAGQAEPVVAASLPPAGGSPSAGYWPWLAGVLGLGWLSTALAWWWRRHQTPDRSPAPRLAVGSSERALLDALEQACRANAAGTARRALTGWAAERWPGVPAAALERHCGGDLGREIGRLNRALYAADASHWNGADLWAAFEAYRKAHGAEAGLTAQSPGLEPLYKS
jgi:hypothetical protein